MLPIAAFAILFACATPSAPEPTPTPETSASQYLSDAAAFWKVHAQTLGELTATVNRLSSESATKAEFRYRSLAGLMRINQTAPADEIIASMQRLGELSPEERAALDGDLENLQELLHQVKRDQVKLLQILPGQNLPTAFHETAMMVMDQESVMLLDLISFYSSPGLQRKSEAFEDFPKTFKKAETQLAFALQAWTEATSALASLTSPLRRLKRLNSPGDVSGRRLGGSRFAWHTG